MVIILAAGRWFGYGHYHAEHIHDPL